MQFLQNDIRYTIFMAVKLSQQLIRLMAQADTKFWESKRILQYYKKLLIICNLQQFFVFLRGKREFFHYHF